MGVFGGCVFKDTLLGRLGVSAPTDEPKRAKRLLFI